MQAVFRVLAELLLTQVTYSIVSGNAGILAKMMRGIEDLLAGEFMEKL
jgi:hypothetical protein